MEQVARIRFPAPSETRKPQNLPYASLGSLFKGREEAMRGLAESLQSQHHAAAVVARQAIHGLGGIGKTRLAIEYAWENRQRYSALLFVPANTAEDLRRSLVSLCDPLVLNLPEQTALEEESRGAAAIRWLEQHPGWLLIFDNVDTEQAAGEVEKLLPALQRGHVLITSRLSEWGEGVDPMRLDVLDAEVSAAFLLERTAGKRRVAETDEADAAALAEELDGLALALEQAGAFVRRMRCSLGDYLTRWRSREEAVRGWCDWRQVKYEKSVAVTWETTVEQLPADARALLRLLSWLAPELVPVELLHGEKAPALFSEAVTRLDPDRASADVEAALASLAGYSMVQWDLEGDGQRFSVHRVVQEITRWRVPEEERASWIERALRLVDAHVLEHEPWDVRSWPVWEPLRPHALALVEHADAAGIREPTSLGDESRAGCPRHSSCGAAFQAVILSAPRGRRPCLSF